MCDEKRIGALEERITYLERELVTLSLRANAVIKIHEKRERDRRVKAKKKLEQEKAALAPPYSRTGATTWEFVNSNPGCSAYDLQRKIGGRYRVALIDEIIKLLAEEGKVIHRIKGPRTGGRRGFRLYTEAQLEAEGLWPIPWDRRVEK